MWGCRNCDFQYSAIDTTSPVDADSLTGGPNHGSAAFLRPHLQDGAQRLDG